MPALCLNPLSGRIFDVAAVELASVWVGCLDWGCQLGFGVEWMFGSTLVACKTVSSMTLRPVGNGEDAFFSRILRSISSDINSLPSIWGSAIVIPCSYVFCSFPQFSHQSFNVTDEKCSTTMSPCDNIYHSASQTIVNCFAVGQSLTLLLLDNRELFRGFPLPYTQLYTSGD